MLQRQSYANGTAAARARLPVLRVPGPIMEIGGMVLLFSACVRGMFARPITYGPELVTQARFVLKICVFPLILVGFALSFGPAGVQGSNFFGLIGAFDRMGAAWQIVVTRLFGPLTTAIVLAGAAGTAITADLGARVVREEIDALHVLGVNTVRNLVVPRVLVLMVSSIVFNTFALIAGLGGALLVLVQHGQSFGPFLDVFFANASLIELVGAFTKSAIYGTVIAVVCCYKGLSVSGGAQGVGRAVNQAIVICFLAIAVIDFLFSQILLATNPVLSTPRG